MDTMRRIKPFNGVEELFIAIYLNIHRQLIKIQDLKLMPYRKKLRNFCTLIKFNEVVFLINKLFKKKSLYSFILAPWDPITLEIWKMIPWCCIFRGRYSYIHRTHIWPDNKVRSEVIDWNISSKNARTLESNR